MNKREYLRSQGFKVGDRGRLTPAMIQALEGFTEIPQQQVLEVLSYPANKTYVQNQMIRESKTLYGITKEGKKVGFTTCSDCDEHMSICSCQDGILAPIIVVLSKEKGVRVGTPTNNKRSV